MRNQTDWSWHFVSEYFVNAKEKKSGNKGNGQTETKNKQIQYSKTFQVISSIGVIEIKFIFDLQVQKIDFSWEGERQPICWQQSGYLYQVDESKSYILMG